MQGDFKSLAAKVRVNVDGENGIGWKLSGEESMTDLIWQLIIDKRYKFSFRHGKTLKLIRRRIIALKPIDVYSLNDGVTSPKMLHHPLETYRLFVRRDDYR
mmetsp:Transcript_7927/g.15774  ORF Transcript_7927/g.15774 Transcript_7927/m.15774 type:complete len:101 (-) Transcript_7927:20-322(-)